MRRMWRVLVVVLAVFASRAGAQADSVTQEPLRVFLDCETSGCDPDFFRTEVTWVNFVRDRMAADVHVLVTSDRTGSGGRRFVVTFQGRGGLDAMRDSVTVSTGLGDTQDVQRRELIRTIGLGLVRFVQTRSVATQLRVTLTPTTTPAVATGARGAKDRWNLWVFSVSANSFANGDENYKSANLFGNLSARRVTDKWKINLSFNGEYSENKFKLTDYSVATYQHEFRWNQLIVKSLNDHWSAGVDAGVSREKFANIRLGVRSLAALEWDLFPYAEATRRQLLVRYGVGLRSFTYDSVTVYDKTEETRPVQELAIAAEARQPWGSLNIGVNGSQYLDDMARNRLSVSGGVSWRIARGLDLNLGGYYARTRDQLNIARGSATNEDILTRLRQLRSGYSYFGSLGLSYTFGSIFNNVVNPRFGRNGGGGISISF